MMSELFIKHPRAITVRLNSDEQLGVYVKGMCIVNDNEIRVAGFIEREDSQIIRRAHRPTLLEADVLNELASAWYVKDYHEYDDNDGGQIHVELVITRDAPWNHA
jgi:hypothetical protein